VSFPSSCGSWLGRISWIEEPVLVGESGRETAECWKKSFSSAIKSEDEAIFRGSEKEGIRACCEGSIRGYTV